MNRKHFHAKFQSINHPQRWYNSNIQQPRTLIGFTENFLLLFSSNGHSTEMRKSLNRLSPEPAKTHKAITTIGDKQQTTSESSAPTQHWSQRPETIFNSPTTTFGRQESINTTAVFSLDQCGSAIMQNVKKWIAKRHRPAPLYLVLALSVAHFVTQMVTCHVTHALTLLVDSCHMLCNIVALVGCILTLKVSIFGYGRMIRL